MTDIDRRTLLASTVGASVLALVSGAAFAAPADAATTSRRVLRLGSSGADVLAAQRAMNRAGFWLGGLDGIFGALTQQAVWALQKTSRLYRDAIVGPMTWAAIDSGRRAMPRYAGDHIEIDKTRQLLIVTRAGRSDHTFNTSTGSGQAFTYQGRRMIARTPSGSYRVYRANTRGWEYGSLGGLYKPFYFDGGIAIHGSPSIPPYPDSHGCCRVSTAGQNFLISSRGLLLNERVYVY